MNTNSNNNYDPSKWKYGIFYYNKEDKRLWVPKRVPWTGFTLNFANPYSHVVMAIIILFATLFPLVISRIKG
ncbi:MAG TPA: DUF5808 domain-containing protein [Bacteroidia bacterium]|nr:DUF5808 domain-containing protein [Bacteroidia bacterium]